MDHAFQIYDVIQIYVMLCGCDTKFYFHQFFLFFFFCSFWFCSSSHWIIGYCSLRAHKQHVSFILQSSENQVIVSCGPKEVVRLWNVKYWQYFEIYMYQKRKSWYGSRGSARFLAKIEHDSIYFFFKMKKQNNQFVIGSVYFDFGLFFGFTFQFLLFNLGQSTVCYLFL